VQAAKTGVRSRSMPLAPPWGHTENPSHRRIFDSSALFHTIEVTKTKP